MRSLPKGYHSWEALYERMQAEIPDIDKKREFFFNNEYFTREELFEALAKELLAQNATQLQIKKSLIPSDSADLIVLAIEGSNLASDTKDNLKRTIEPLTRKGQ